MWETITQLLTSGSPVEIICLIFSVLSILASFVVAFAYNNSKLRDWMLVCVGAICLIVLLIHSNTEPTPNVYPLYLVLWALTITFIFNSIYLMRDRIRNERKQDEQEDSEETLDLQEVTAVIEDVKVDDVMLFHSKINVKMVYLTGFDYPIIISDYSLGFLLKKLGTQEIIGMKATVEYFIDPENLGFFPETFEIQGISAHPIPQCFIEPLPQSQ